MENNNVFALDIGTRTVIGLILKNTGEKLEILAQHVETHKDRAMKDGQIHDVVKVSEIVKKVKESLEKKTNLNLTSASIAAAGRTLRTVRGVAFQDYNEVALLDQRDLQRVEVEALVRCKEDIIKQYPDEALYCVGYSVLKQKLNNYSIDRLVGQKGGYVEMEIIATFLPNVVVDSLFEVLKKVNLAIESLTLEPIAAMEMAIPSRFRMLNIALVDIGAGTSDIAISKGGTIIGYGMVQKAGDKITEALAEHYLIDFQTAEELKISLSTGKDITITDILGIKQQVGMEDFERIIGTAVGELVNDISNEIISLNGKPPSAVFCVGGGSQVELIRLKLAEKLSLPVERVAIRGRDTLENVKFRNNKSKKLAGPEIITPLGIGAIAIKRARHNFITVSVNQKEVAIFNATKTTVAQGLFSAGVRVEDILKGGKANDLVYRIQGDEITMKGAKGFPGEILLNNKKASLEDVVTQGDEITAIFPEKPNEHKLLLKEVIKQYHRSILLNGEKVELLQKVLINNSIENENYLVKNGDEIEIIYKYYLEEILGEGNGNFDVYIDGEKAQGNPMILNCREITYSKRSIQSIDKSPSTLRNSDITVKANNQSVVIEKNNPVIVDVFDKIQFDISNPKGSLMIRKNGMESNFTDSVKQGDLIEIYWN